MFEPYPIKNRNLESILTALRSFGKSYALPLDERIRFAELKKEIADTYGGILELNNELREAYGEEGVVEPGDSGWKDYEEEVEELLSKEADIEFEPFYATDIEKEDTEEEQKYLEDFDTLYMFGIIVKSQE